MNQQRFLITSTDKAFVCCLIDFLNDYPAELMEPGTTMVRLLEELDVVLPDLSETAEEYLQIEGSLSPDPRPLEKPCCNDSQTRVE